jgi:hypothetical protein
MTPQKERCLKVIKNTFSRTYPLIFKKERAMNMTSRTFFKTVCPIIALLFFFATITPGIVKAQANGKSENANSLSMLQLALSGKNSQASLSAEARLAIKLKALIDVENLFSKIAQSGFTEKTLQEYGYILPQGFAVKIMLISDIAKADMPTEEKVTTLVNAFDIDCGNIVWLASVIEVLSWFNLVPYLGYFGNVLFAAAALCYYGLI